MIIMASNIRERRARRAKSAIKKADDLYSDIGIDPSLTIIDEEQVTDIPADSGIQESVDYARVERKAKKPLVASEYDYELMADTYSEQNVAQQLGNYRRAMEFLASITPGHSDKIVNRLQKLIYDYPNVDISSFVNKENALLYSWITTQMINSFGEKYLGAVYCLGGGMGILPALMFDTKLRFENIRSFDINGTCQFLADEMMSGELLQDWRFKACTQDLFNLGYDEHQFITQLQNGSLSTPFTEIPGTLINTNISYLRHYDDWWKMIPDMRRIIIVGETGDVPRPFASSQAFNRKFTMSYELYTGVKQINDKHFYMKIGYK